jgi:hypothetical protein
MSGHGKSMMVYDWLIAFETAFHGLLELDKPIAKDRGEGPGEVYVLMVDRMETEIPSAEETFLRKEAYSSLSKEAKEIINIVLNAPDEIMECLTCPKYNKISKSKIKTYLMGQGWNRQKVKSCFAELKGYASEIG